LDDRIWFQPIDSRNLTAKFQFPDGRPYGSLSDARACP
jgi:hypothetical protein